MSAEGRAGSISGWIRCVIKARKKSKIFIWAIQRRELPLLRINLYVGSVWGKGSLERGEEARRYCPPNPILWMFIRLILSYFHKYKGEIFLKMETEGQKCVILGHGSRTHKCICQLSRSSGTRSSIQTLWQEMLRLLMTLDKSCILSRFHLFVF